MNTKKTRIAFLLYLFISGLNVYSQNFWTQKANFGGTGRRCAVGFDIGLKGYLGTGTGSETDDFWEYDSNNNSWTQKANFPGGLRDNTVSFSISYKGYIGMGILDTLYLKKRKKLKITILTI